MAAAPPDSPVYDIETEQAVLGAILTRNESYDLISDTLTAEHFYEHLHGRIYQSIAALIRMGRTASVTSISKVMAADDGLKSVGGKDYLTMLTRRLIALPLPDLGKTIRELSTTRSLIRVAEDVIAAAKGGGTQTAEQLIEHVEDQLHALTTGTKVEYVRTASAVVADAVQAAERAYQNPEAVGCSTGLKKLDDVMGLLAPSDLVVLGGATSAGKTAAAQQIAWSVAKTGRRVMAFSLEMTDVQYMMRHLAQASGVPASLMEYGKVSEEQMTRIVAAERDFDSLPYGIDGSPRLSVSQIRSRVRRANRRGGEPVSLVMVDHLRFIEPHDPRAFERDQLQQITRDLKALGKELNCCVVLVAHINRENWKRENKRPQLSDLYGAAAIEQNADVVVFVHRPEYWLEKNRPEDGDMETMGEWAEAMRKVQGLAEFVVAKRRRGPTGAANVKFDKVLTRFYDPDEATAEQKNLV